MSEGKKAKELLARVIGPGVPELSCEECFAQFDRYVELALADADEQVPGMGSPPRGLPRLRRGLPQPEGLRRGPEPGAVTEREPPEAAPLAAWQLPLIVATIAIAIVGGFYLGGPGLGMAIGGLAAAAIVVMAVRKPPRRAIVPPSAHDLRRHVLVVLQAPLEQAPGPATKTSRRRSKTPFGAFRRPRWWLLDGSGSLRTPEDPRVADLRSRLSVPLRLASGRATAPSETATPVGFEFGASRPRSAGLQDRAVLRA